MEGRHRYGAWHQYRLPAREPTPRQLEILSLVREGCTNKQIGIIFGISENTVKGHVKNAAERLGAVDRTSTVIHAIRGGHLTVDSKTPSGGTELGARPPGKA